MSWTVLSVAYPLAPVSLATTGGAEQVLASIDSALVRAGHRSIVIARGDSLILGELVGIPVMESLLDDEAKVRAQSATRDAITRTLSGTHIDLVQLHGIDFASYIPDTTVPVLATLHLPPEWYPPEIFSSRLALHCVSESQHRSCPPASNLLPPIPNGVDLNLYRPAFEPGHYVLLVARICPEKGIHLAIKACDEAEVPLIIAGDLFPYTEHVEYFEREVRPRIDGRKVRWIGRVAPERKRYLMSGARCVLITSLVQETSSLVAMEAAACGTPVVALPAGALPEVVADGTTGLITTELAKGIADVSRIDRKSCREHAEHWFDIGRTLERYFDLYSRLTVRPSPAEPYSVEVITTAEALRDLRTDWLQLYDRCPNVPPFVHPDWSLNWWDIFGTCPLHTIVLRHRGRLTGLAPCFVDDDRLVFIGNGISDRLDVLADTWAAGREIARLLASCDYGLDLQEIPPGSPLLTMSHTPCSVCPVASLEQDLPSKLRKKLRLAREYVERHVAPITFETATTETAPELMEALFRLHSAVWPDRNGSEVLADERTREFHRRVARTGLPTLHGLRVNGELRAVLYGFSRGGTFLYYLAGHDPALERYSPGSLLTEYAISRPGLLVFDFLRGAESYKYRWGGRDCHHSRIYSQPG